MTKIEKIQEAYYDNPEFSRAAMAKSLSVDESYVRKSIRKLKKNEVKQGHKPLEEIKEFNITSKNNATLRLDSLTINTLDKALAVADVDLTQWKVDRYRIGSHQVTIKRRIPTKKMDKDGNVIYIDKPKTVTMYNIQVHLKRLHGMEWVKAIRLLVKDIPKLKTPKKEYKRDSEYLLEVSLLDIHFGMLAWDKEVGQDYDLKIAENIYLNAIRDLLDKTAPYKPAKILFPFGNDFLHINDATNSTPLGKNPLDTDSRLIKIYQTAKLAAIKAINHCRAYAPVDVIWIPGNHDPDVSYYMCDVLDEVFSKDKDVTVNKSPKTRKFYPWGESLVAFAHGHDEPLNDLPNIVATEEPKLWGASKYREIHVGHKHTRREFRWMNVNHSHGAVVRMIPSLCATDAWHYRRGYVRGYHAAEAYLWDKANGLIAQFTTYVNY